MDTLLVGVAVVLIAGVICLLLLGRLPKLARSLRIRSTTNSSGIVSDADGCDITLPG